MLKAVRIPARAGVVIYAGSLVNPAVLDFTQTDEIYDSSGVTLEEILDIMEFAVTAAKTVARLHTGDPSLYGAIAEQIEGLEKREIDYETVPGISFFLAAAAALGCEFTVPEVSQTLILTRMAGRTLVPAGENWRPWRHTGHPCASSSAPTISNPSLPSWPRPMAAIRRQRSCIRFPGRGRKRCSGGAWATSAALVQVVFRRYRRLVFIMSCGIVVRMIAPYLNNKWSDPAVVVLDEGGNYAVPLRRRGAVCPSTPNAGE